MLEVEAQRASLIAFRRDLHQHPEVSGQEERTASAIATRLEALGFQVRRNIGGHGIVASLRGARSGPVVAFRADMDAVYSNAPDPVEFASTYPGVRHICGHDIHSTIGIALAEGFAAIRADLAGTVVLIFQHAEESGVGARQMLDAQALPNIPSAIFAVHTTPYQVGTIAVTEGVQMVARDLFQVSISGPQAREAMSAMQRRLLAIGDAPAFRPQPRTSDFVHVDAGAVQEGEAIVQLSVSFNAATEAARRRAQVAAEAAVVETRGAYPAAQIGVTYQRSWLPGVYNDTALTQRAVASIREALGPSSVVEVTTVTPGFSEDFGHFQAQAPGVMFFLGVSNRARGWVGMPHTPDYVADEDSIFVASRALLRVMLDAMTFGA